MAGQPLVHSVLIFIHLYDSAWKKIHSKSGNRTQTCCSWGGRLTTRPVSFTWVKVQVIQVNYLERDSVRYCITDAKHFLCEAGMTVIFFTPIHSSNKADCVKLLTDCFHFKEYVEVISDYSLNGFGLVDCYWDPLDWTYMYTHLSLTFGVWNCIHSCILFFFSFTRLKLQSDEDDSTPLVSQAAEGFGVCVVWPNSLPEWFVEVAELQQIFCCLTVSSVQGHCCLCWVLSVAPVYMFSVCWNRQVFVNLAKENWMLSLFETVLREGILGLLQCCHPVWLMQPCILWHSV